MGIISKTGIFVEDDCINFIDLQFYTVHNINKIYSIDGNCSMYKDRGRIL